MKRWDLTFATLLVLATLIEAKADLIVVESDTTWRAIGPVGNLEGRAIGGVGTAWEILNAGWNTDPLFDDSDAAGWTYAGHYNPSWPDKIWVDGNGLNGSTPAYFRKAFSIPGTVTQGLLDVTVDDDALVYVNGTLVVNDQDGRESILSDIDVTASLTPGVNLVAVKAHDSFGIEESLYVRLDAEWNPIPEPSILVALTGLLATGLIGHWWRRRKRKLGVRPRFSFSRVAG